MDDTFELNTVNNAKDKVGTFKVKFISPVAETLSALMQGKSLSSFDGKVVGKSIRHIKDLADHAIDGDRQAVSELNAIQRLTIEPKLIEAIKIFNLMGTRRSVSYNIVPMMKAYRYESIDFRFRASSGDAPFVTYSFREYSISTQTISSDYAVDCHELQSNNFDGTTAEGISQAQIDVRNEAVYYVVVKLYDALKSAKGVRHFAENSGTIQTAIDEILEKMYRYGHVNICGDYSIIFQFNDFAGYKTFGASTISLGADVAAEEIRKTGLLSSYNGSHVVKLPNALDLIRMNAGKTPYELYMPQGLLFFTPQSKVAPLQIFRRGGITIMTGDDIATRQHLTRSDMEIDASVTGGTKDQIGLLSGTNFGISSL